MTAYEDARSRVKTFFEIASLTQADKNGMRGVVVSMEILDALRVLTLVPESPVVNLVSDSYRGTNATGIRLGELEQHVATLGERVGQLAAVVDRILTAVEQ